MASDDHENKYCLGFMYSAGRGSVLLIEKKRPSWQAGLWNGVGGHIKKGESADEAMVREFEEETGVRYENWHLALNIKVVGPDVGESAELIVFRAISAEVTKARSQTDESLFIFNVNDMPYNVIPNLKLIVPMLSQSIMFPLGMVELVRGGVEEKS